MKRAFSLLSLGILSIAFYAGVSSSAHAQDTAAHSETEALLALRSQYLELAGNGGWPAWHAGKKLVPGAKDARVPTLREILTITGDYRPGSGISSASTQYDDALVEAARRFQSRHGLGADGRLGRATQAALGVPVAARLEQIDATLAAMRAHPFAPERKFILVNLPAYTLYAVEEGRAAAVMRVIVGNRENPTPLFDNAITDVVFNPSWHVPERIARNEMMQKLHDDPDYFIDAGFVISEDGTPIDAHAASVLHHDDYAFRQRPGEDNALGKVKFNIPDDEDVYLHSTPNPRLFTKDDRALSHGCIRVEKPRDLTYFVFGGKEGWDKAKIDRYYDEDTEHSIRVDAVPVHLVYWTAFVDAGGTAHFYDDMYGLNKAPEKPKGRAMTVASSQ